MDAAPTGLRDLTVEEARARMVADLPPVAAETALLSEALGRVLAEDVSARRDQPPFDASAMDGWAVRGAGERFEIVGESAAGHGHAAPLSPGQAVRIFTGAPVPGGADRVVIQEEARREDGFVIVPTATGGARHIRPAGGDFRSGDVLLRAGTRLDPWRLGLAAAAGRDRLSVARRPRVAVLATGEELVAPGGEPRADQIFNSGAAALEGLVRLWGGEPIVLDAAGDDLASIAGAVAGAGGDVVVTLGGASVGDHDLVKPALARLGLDLRVETVRLRPGKPTWFGRLADGRRVVGLPGNPASGLVCAELFLHPLLMALQGAEPGPALDTARLAAPMPANGPREHWARARLWTAEGILMAEPMTDQDSSLVSVFAQAAALIRRPAGAEAADIGAVASVLRLGRL
jgi:molybdopterin molybdotransferase